MAKRAIMFDLDGTLVPMDYDQFTKTYFQLLARTVIPLGYEAETLVPAVWKGVKAMVVSDNGKTCEDTFWDTFAGEMGPRVYQDKEAFMSFYRNEFDQAKAVTGPNPLAREAVELARQKADMVILATNSLFPLDGLLTRMRWVGLEKEDFDFITSYDQVHSCKPNPNYYREILAHCGLAPADCLMIGNDVQEDIQAAKSVGMDTWLVKDCLIGDETAVKTPGGSFGALVEYLRGLPEK